MAPGNRFSGAKLLFTDAEVAALVLNEFRHRIITRVSGIQSREGSFSSLLITMIAIGAVAAGIQGAGAKVREVQTSPSLGDALIGGAIAKQSIAGIAGAASKDTSSLGTLIVFALVARSARPVVAGTYRGIRAQRRRLRAAMRGRYGRAGGGDLVNTT